MEEEGQGRGSRGVEAVRRQVELSRHVEGVVAEEVNDEGDKAHAPPREKGGERVGDGTEGQSPRPAFDFVFVVFPSEIMLTKKAVFF